MLPGPENAHVAPAGYQNFRPAELGDRARPQIRARKKRMHHVGLLAANQPIETERDGDGSASVYVVQLPMFDRTGKLIEKRAGCRGAPEGDDAALESTAGHAAQ